MRILDDHEVADLSARLCRTLSAIDAAKSDFAAKKKQHDSKIAVLEDDAKKLRYSISTRTEEQEQLELVVPAPPTSRENAAAFLSDAELHKEEVLTPIPPDHASPDTWPDDDHETAPAEDEGDGEIIDAEVELVAETEEERGAYSAGFRDGSIPGNTSTDSEEYPLGHEHRDFYLSGFYAALEEDEDGDNKKPTEGEDDE